MRCTIILLYLFTTSNLVYAQENHHDINQGNRYLLLCDYINAGTYYEKAFANGEHFYFEDIKKLIFTHFKLNRKEKVLAYLRFLVEKRKFHPYKIRTEFPYLKLPRKEMQTLLKSYEFLQQKTIDSDVIFLKEMFIKDQAIRRYDLIKGNDNEIAKQIYKSRDSLDDIHSVSLLNFLKTNSWPNEATTGIYLDNDTKWARVPYVLGIHFVRQQPELLQYFKTNMQKGNIHPSIYASICDFYFVNTGQKDSTLNYMNTTVSMIDNVPYTKGVYYSDSLMAYVNANRVSIGLDSFFVTQKQVVASHFYQCNTFRENKIELSSYPFTNEIPAGIARWASKHENVDMDNWKINLDKIKSPCICQKK